MNYYCANSSSEVHNAILKQQKIRVIELISYKTTASQIFA